MLLDTDFLIDLTGSRSSQRQRLAFAFLERQADQPCFISPINWSEFAEGVAHRSDLSMPLSKFACLNIAEDTAWLASRVARQLKRSGLHIGDNDVWQAALALEYGLPLVTGNLQHFSRVADLIVYNYR